MKVSVDQMDKKYDHSQAEKQLQAQWEGERTYAHEHNPGPLYSVDTPPPTVSGSLHIGHLFSYTQTDIIARYKRMGGYSVFYPFGFDDNGLATERFVEKERGIRAHDLSRSDFINVCLEETAKAEGAFKDLWQRMGLSADWNAEYSTISPSVRRISQASFIDLYNKDYVYRKQEPALYCGACRTSIAQADLDDKELLSSFNDIVFKDEQGNELLIGTTRPELLPSCVAMFFHPSDERYQHLAGKKAIVPIFEFEVPIMPDESVDPLKGTGLVMCCTFGDKTDIEWFKKYRLPYKQSIGFDGKMMECAGPLAGKKPAEARAAIIALLKERNLLLRERPITHAVSVHERCKKEIEYVVLPQWFINVLDYKQQLIKQADSINWYPAFMKTRYVNWVENINWDWCISRQRFFGIPFPVWHCNACGQVLVADVKDLPIDPQERPYPGGACTACKSTDIRPDTDVMDTWNTSSITPYICAELFDGKQHDFAAASHKNFVPMSMRPQAHDIIRTWAFYTITKAWMHENSIPWKDIVISGHVLAGQGGKISKSQGGAAITPDHLLSRFPADAIRYWTASGSLGHDIAFSEDQIKNGIRLVTKLWNAFIFIKPHIEACASKPEYSGELGVANEWILDSASHAYERYCQHLENHEFGLALDVIERFFWSDVCDNYLELIKHQLFNPHEYDERTVAATRWTLYTLGLRILQLYAPYVPYVTEAIYQSLYRKLEQTASLHQTRYVSVQTVLVFERSARIAKRMMIGVAQVRKLKSDNQLPLNEPLARLTIHADDELCEAIHQNTLLLKGVTRAAHIECVSDALQAPNIEKHEDGWHAAVSAAAAQ
jgi:valyl-tRNA synthetase